MSDSQGFFGAPFVPKAIVSKVSTTLALSTSALGWTSQSALADTALIEALTGACTANTLKTILSITGAGVIPFLLFYIQATTTRADRVKITVDGTVVFDSISASESRSVGHYVEIIGAVQNAVYWNGTGYETVGVTYDNVYFNSSFKVEYSSSLTETDKGKFFYRYLMR
jgi:predicted extracellular nuclease